MRMACPGPSGETFFFSMPAAICFAPFLKRPGPGLVESVFTFPDQRFAGGVADFFAADFFAAFLVAIKRLLLRCDAKFAQQGLAAGAEEGREQRAAFIAENAFDDFYAV